MLQNQLLDLYCSIQQLDKHNLQVERGGADIVVVAGGGDSDGSGGLDKVHIHPVLDTETEETAAHS